jgi:50S ribosomal protein L16 3-hydroxylase
MHLDKFDIDGFLRDYWQKKPLLIKNPWETWENPLEPDELAGLACEEGVEARLITQTSDTARNAWKVEHGAFPESRFGQLGNTSWTLLVQAVDHYVPSVAALIEPFRFIPNWRIDDVMVSCAADQGGVGPHFDQYDVFLIQGLGKRRWQVGAMCESSTELLPHDDLRLLANFEASEEWILEPGDILYVPPRVAHNGVAVGDSCVTYSIGFRAPSRSELIGDWCDDLLAEMRDDDRYADPGLRTQDNPGEISAGALAELHAMINETLADHEGFTRWFGTYSSTRKYPDMDWQPEKPVAVDELRESLAGNVPLCRNPASRFAFVRQGADTVLLFVDGECFECGEETAAFAETLCAQDRIAVGQNLIKSDAGMELVAQLINQGSVAFELEG